jgi:hypothetical protein
MVREIGDVVAAYAKFGGVKGEFETSAQFAERVRSAPSQAVVVQFPLLESGFSYDADAGRAKFDRFSTPTTCSIFNGLKEVEQPSLRSRGLSKLCIFKHMRGHISGSYVGTNMFGARAQIAKERDDYEGIFLGYGDILTNPFIIDQGIKSSLFEVSLPPVEAKSLKSNGVMLVVLRPENPFVATGTSYLAPTINSPSEKRGALKLLVGSVVCVGLADKALRRIMATREIHKRSVTTR